MTINVNYHSVTRMLGVLFMVLGISFVPTIVVGLIYGEKRETLCFLATMVPCLLAGLVLMKIFSPTGLKMKAREGYLIVTLSWLVSAAVGAVPMVLTGAMPNAADAFFEICSGFSTTGASVLHDIEGTAKCVLFWRSFTHWLGGMGIIVFATALLPSIGIGGQIVASAETPGPTLSKLTAHFADTAKDLYKLYLAFTAAETILLTAGGMSLYDALIHTFGTVGTGGFSSHSESVGYFTSPYIQWVIIIFMLMCGVNFNLYFLIPRKKIKEFFADNELRAYLALIGVTSLGTVILLMVSGGYSDAAKAVRDAVFQMVSIITTTGYVTADYDIWPTFCKICVLILTITGACSSSTGGGLKVVRALVAAKYVRRGFFLKMHPNRVVNVTLNGKAVSPDVVTNIVYSVFLFAATWFIGAFLVSFDGFDIVTNFSASLTCISNVGPGFSMVGPTMNFEAFSDFSTVVLAILMIAGRLELFTFVMMLSPRFWNSNRA
ncbi:MAG: TrkH family potassium uptake protein [Firmicutes bacterium]|nr:TrkH family potassium uptake protein [Bacillota bacterium]